MIWPQIKLISAVTQWQLGDVFQKTRAVVVAWNFWCAKREQRKGVQFSLGGCRFLWSAEPKIRDGQHVLETVCQVGCAFTNTLYVPEVILLHKGQQPWDSPHPYHLSLTLQDKVATCKLPTRNGSWPLPTPGSCPAMTWENDTWLRPKLSRDQADNLAIRWSDFRAWEHSLTLFALIQMQPIYPF